MNVHHTTQRTRLLAGGVFGMLGVATTLLTGMGDVHAAQTCNGRNPTIVGSGYIYGTDGDDVIMANGLGDDWVFGGKGNDTICAPDHGHQVERATLLGDEGDDWILGGYGPDLITGGSGNDQIFGFEGDDRLEGGGGVDAINGGRGVDTAVYSNAPAGVNVEFTIYAGSASGGDGIDGLHKIENVVGSNFDDAITGSADVNELTGDGGNDTINGRGGSDRINAEFGNDTIDGGDGADTVVYARSSALVVNLSTDLAIATTFGQPEQDTIKSIENAYGSPGDDTLTGDNYANSLRGGMGNDTINGARGNDFLYGDDGVDRFDGGFGSDWCEARSGDAFIRCEDGMIP